MSEENITTPGNESHQLQAPGPGFDCTVKHAKYAKSAKNANTMATIANTMENQQQQMNKITDILARGSQFLVRGGVPPSISQQTAFRPEYS